MLKFLIAIVFVVVSLPGFSQEKSANKLDEEGRKTGWWTAYDQQGNIIYTGFFVDGHPVDTLRRYYPDGTLKALMVYDPAGIKVEAEIYDEQGCLRACGNYLNQLKQGPWVFYSPQNKPLFKINYVNDSLDGLAVRYYANGIIMEKTRWSGNKMDGLQEVFNENGDKISEYNYNNGQLNGKYTVYNPNGSIAIIGYYRENLKDGNWIYFNENGDEDYTLNYSAGKLTNPGILEDRRKEVFEQYEKNRTLIKDPNLYLSDPRSYFRK